MATFREVSKRFYSLSKTDQTSLLAEIYNYSRDMKLFFESKLGLQYNTEWLIREMENETIGKVYRRGNPQTPDGKKINTIISKAKKAQVSPIVLLKLEQLAYRGFIEYLNEYGGGPENFDGMACNHIEKYLVLAKNHIQDENKRRAVLEEVRTYLRSLDNMLTDNLYDTYEMVTGKQV